MNNQFYFKRIINDSVELIDKNIYKFLFLLLKSIFLKQPDNYKTISNFKLNDCIENINLKIIKDKENYISKDYTISNFKNLINFVKTQNRLFAGDILEGILIKITSFAFKLNQDDTLGKYVFNNLFKIKNKSNYEFSEWIQLNKFKPPELHNIEELLSMDNYNNKKEFLELFGNSPFYYLLFNIYKEKYKYISKISNNNTMYYINRGPFESLKNLTNIYNYLDNNCHKALERDIKDNSISNLINSIYNYQKNEKCPIFKTGLIRKFFISVFIYYQNKNSPLMNYIEINSNDKELVKIPFEYNLYDAYIEGEYANTVECPIIIEPRISNLIMGKNNLRECGLYGLAKVLIFNKQIKNIDYQFSIVRANYIDFLNFGLGIFDNDSVERLNLSYNLLNENSEEYLAKIISNFKGLKTLNLSKNTMKGGLSSFFLVLKKLYRKGETKLENLFLNDCALDDSSYYELNELLKCKYCKLKKLSLNNNPIPLNINFLKKLKKNKSLSKIFLSKNQISEKNVNDIMKIISNTEIRHLYLYKNEINNFNNGLKIIYRTKLINQDNMNIQNKDSFLTNLDISNNNFLNKNSNHIKLLNNIINNTTLNCLDISHILYGLNPIKMKSNMRNEEYRNNIEALKINLFEKKQFNLRAIKELKKIKIDLKKLKNQENDNIFQNLNGEINEIIKNKKAIFPIYLRENARKFIKDKNNVHIFKKIRENNNEDDNNIKKINNIEQNLVNFMMYKRRMKEFKEFEKVKKEKKLILL